MLQAKRVPGTNVTYKDLAALLETIMASPLITAKQDNGTNDQVPFVDHQPNVKRDISGRLFFWTKRLLRIPNPTTAPKDEGGKILITVLYTPNNCHLPLKTSKVWVGDPGSEIPDPEEIYPRIPDPKGSKKYRIRNTGSTKAKASHCINVPFSNCFFFCFLSFLHRPG